MRQNLEMKIIGSKRHFLLMPLPSLLQKKALHFQEGKGEVVKMGGLPPPFTDYIDA
jgi:hypothetical protein